MKPQRYKDDRPAEYFDQFHAAARGGVGWTYTFVRILLSLPTLLLWRVRAIGVEQRAEVGAADAGAEPLQPDGPLLHRPLPAPQDPLHGQIADLRAARPHLRLQARRRLPRAPRPSRRGGVQDRLHAPRPRRRCCSSTPRAAARARVGCGEPKAGIGRLALESGAPVVPVAIHGSASVRRWKRFTFPKVTVQYRGAAQLPGRGVARARAPARGRGGDLRPRAGDVRGPRGGASFTSTQRGLRKTRSPPLTFRATWAGESRANVQQR